MEFATRKQLQKLHNLGTDRNANRVLKGLGEWVVRGSLDGEYVYYLSEYGAKWLGVDKGTKWNDKVRHKVMRNELFIFYNCPSDWENEKHVEFTANVKQQGLLMKKNKAIVPDSRFTKDGIRHYVEVDNTRMMNDNQSKLRDYAYLQEAYMLTNGKTFKLIIYTQSSHRKQQFLELLNKYKIKGEVFTPIDLAP